MTLRFKRGFTLIEVLVSMVILSLLMLTTMAAMRAFGKTQVTLEEVTYRVEDIRMVNRFLRNSLESMLGSGTNSASRLTTGGGPSNGNSAFFEGSRMALSWHAPMVFGEANGGVVALRLAKEDRDLVLRWQNLLPVDQEYQWEEANSKILIEKVGSIEVQYRAEFGENWIDQWDSTQGAPMTVRVSLQVDGRYWPELIVAL